MISWVEEELLVWGWKVKTHKKNARKPSYLLFICFDSACEGSKKAKNNSMSSSLEG